MRIQFSKLFFLILTLSNLLTSGIISGQKLCNTDQFLNNQIETNPLLKEKLNDQEAQLLRSNSSPYRDIIVIPLVIHVVYHESYSGLSLEIVQAQLDQLNDDFNALNSNLSTIPSVFQEDKANVAIKFCITHLNSLGEPMIGLEQKSTSILNFGDKKDELGFPKLKHTILNGFDTWDSSSFINIWVADFSSIAGEATLPGTANPEIDGIMIDYDHFGGTHRTLTHEMGHYLNLMHLWGMSENCVQDDLVSDTPSQSKAHYNCPAHPQLSCGSADMFMNFMDFTDDSCVSFFTKGQKERMHQSLLLFRNSLLDKSYCQTSNASFDLHRDLYISHQRGMITVHVKTIPTEKIRLAIYDITGRLVRQKIIVPNSSKQIRLNELPHGMYFLEIQYSDQITAKKILSTH